jgi:hypothetical protein
MFCSIQEPPLTVHDASSAWRRPTIGGVRSPNEAQRRKL